MRKLLLLLSFIIAPPLLAAIGPEFALAPPVIGTAPGNQAGVSIASDGSGFFAVWPDRRTGAAQVYGTRLAADGTPVDSKGILLPARQPSEAHVVWTDSNYLTIWDEAGSSIFVARVTQNGELLDTEGRQLFPADTFLRAVAGNGSVAAIVAYGQFDSPGFVAIVGADANVIARTDLPPLRAGESITEVDIAWNGNSFVVAQAIAPVYCSECGWVERVTFVSPDGVIERHADTPALLMGGRYTIAALPDRFMVAAATWTKGYNAWIFTNDGRSVGDTLGFAWDTPAYAPVAAVTDGDSFVLVWPEWKSPSARLLGMRIGAVGNGITGPSVLATSSTSFDAPAVARSSAGAFAVSWSATSPTGETDVFSRVIASSLTPQTETALLSRAASAEQQPVVGTNGTTWLVSWAESDGVSRRLLARRFAADGDALDPAPLEVAPVTYISGPSIASNGHDYLVTWVNSGTLYFRRLSSAGEWLDSQPRTIGDGAWNFSRQAAGWDGRRYFVAWSRFSENPAEPHLSVAGSQIDGAGSVSAPIVISETMPGSEVAAARLGDRWLVVWTYMPPFPCQILCPGGDTDIIGTRVTFDGVVVDPIPIQFSTPNALATDFAHAPMLASAGETVLVAWRGHGEVRATQITSAGMIDGGVGGNGTKLLNIERQWADTSVAFDGRDYLLLVSDPAVDSPKPVTLYRFELPGALTNGVDLSVGRIPLFQGMFNIALGARPGGKAIAIYPRLTGPEYGGVNRLFARTIAARERVRPTKR